MKLLRWIQDESDQTVYLGHIYVILSPYIAESKMNKEQD